MKFRIIILSTFCLLSAGLYAQEDNSKLRKDSLRAITDESIGIPEMSPVNNGMKKPEVKAETEIQNTTDGNTGNKVAPPVLHALLYEPLSYVLR